MSLRAQATLHSPAERVWRLISEFEYWPMWGSSIRAVRPTTGSVAPGAKGRVRTVFGVWLGFEIIDVEPGRSWSWRVAGIEATRHTVEPLDADRCRLEFTAPVWAAPYVLVLRRAVDNVATMAEAG